MKPISVRRFCRLPWLLWLMLMLFLPLIVWLFAVGIAEAGVASGDGIGLLLIAVFLLLLLAVGLGFYACYGIRITKKWVSVIYIDTIRFFRYEDVALIRIGFDEKSVFGSIKAAGQPLYTFRFDEFSLARHSYAPFAHLWTVKVRIRPKYVEKCIRRLGACEKVQAFSRLAPPSKKG